MVATRQANPHALGASEIRSGMSVQDLKQLTKQRQRMEYETQARNSPRQQSPPQHRWSACVSSNSPYSSPQRSYTQYPSSYVTSASSSGRRSRSPSWSPSGPERMLVTYGGQVVSLMEGVVNAPTMALEYPPELVLNALQGC